MKNLKIILALLLLTGFTFSCTPQAINDDNPTEVVGTGDDDSTTVDTTRD